LIARGNERRWPLHQRLNHFIYRLKVFFLGLVKLIHVEMISWERVLLHRFALIQASGAFIYHKSLYFVSANLKHDRPTNEYSGILVNRANITRLLLEEAGHASHVPLLPGLEEHVHQIHQGLIPWRENVQFGPLDLAVFVLILDHLEYFCLIQATGTTKRHAKNQYAGGRFVDSGPISVGSLCVNSLNSVSRTPLSSNA